MERKVVGVRVANRPGLVAGQEQSVDEGYAVPSDLWGLRMNVRSDCSIKE